MWQLIGPHGCFRGCLFMIRWTSDITSICRGSLLTLLHYTFLHLRVQGKYKKLWEMLQRIGKGDCSGSSKVHIFEVEDVSDTFGIPGPSTDTTEGKRLGKKLKIVRKKSLSVSTDVGGLNFMNSRVGFLLPCG
ncbi:hypothetical protein GOP47_0021268 [Adiantum capillus-veneris]|uniref:Uncharacterized protein n=1 Tax=Adiantum capillus-veneris TaxID=13818 RepID=A0A9D4Z6Y3_ADICA|nr:hypothetical protein GOP47_0021268 [Adiantum capillus-veneris]